MHLHEKEPMITHTLWCFFLYNLASLLFVTGSERYYYMHELLIRVQHIYSFRPPLSFTTLHNYIITLSVLLIRDIHSAEQGFSSLCYPHAVYLLDGSAIWLSIYIYILHIYCIGIASVTAS